MFFLHIFPCEAIKNLSTKQDDRGTGCTFPAAIYLPKVNNRTLEQGVKYVQSQL